MSKVSITTSIDSKLLKEFEGLIVKKYGLTNGDIDLAIAEAIKLWIENEKSFPVKPDKRPEIKDLYFK